MLINILEAKNRLSELIRAARDGEEVIIANRGKPVAKLTAIRDTEIAPRGSTAAILGWLDDHPTPKTARRNAAEIDAAIAAEREGWD